MRPDATIHRIISRPPNHRTTSGQSAFGLSTLALAMEATVSSSPPTPSVPSSAPATAGLASLVHMTQESGDRAELANPAQLRDVLAAGGDRG